MFIRFDKSETSLSAKEKAARKKSSEAEESDKADFARMVSEKKNGMARSSATGPGRVEEGRKKEAAATNPAPGNKEDWKQHTFTTQTLGEEGGRDQTFTTQRLGEEGGKDQTFTTQRLGEEGGRDSTFVPRPVERGGNDATGTGRSQAGIGPTHVMVSQLLDEETEEDEDDEEDSSIYPAKPSPTVTTMALDEEGGKNDGRKRSGDR